TLRTGAIFREFNPLEPVLKMGGAGDPPAPVGDPPTGTGASNVAKRPCPLARIVAPVPSGESPDGTGGSPCAISKPFFKHALARFPDGTAFNGLAVCG